MTINLVPTSESDVVLRDYLKNYCKARGLKMTFVVANMLELFMSDDSFRESIINYMLPD